MQFQVTKIEFDFAGDNLFTENDRLDLIEETIDLFGKLMMKMI